MQAGHHPTAPTPPAFVFTIKEGRASVASAVGGSREARCSYLAAAGTCLQRCNQTPQPSCLVQRDLCLLVCCARQGCQSWTGSCIHQSMVCLRSTLAAKLGFRVQGSDWGLLLAWAQSQPGCCDDALIWWWWR